MTSNNTPTQLVAESARTLRRHLLLEVTIAVIVFSAASIVVKRMPDVYRAETRILVNPQRVSDKYVSSAVSMNSTERLNTLSQEVLSSSRLDAILQQLGLFPQLRATMGREQLIDRMRKHISIQLKQSTNGLSSFTLAYTGSSATEVAAVANKLATSFIDSNLRDRAMEAEGTTDFLSGELTGTKLQLDILEEKLRNYKMQHLGQLPDQMQANLQTLSRLQVQLQANTEAQSRLDREAFFAQQGSPVTGSFGSDTSLTLRQQTAMHADQARRELAELRKRYTGDFPNVVSKQEEVEALDAQVKKLDADGASAEDAATPTTGNLESARQLIARDRARLAQEKHDIELAINAYQARVNAEPVREQELSQLLRDYDTAKEHYRSLLEKTYSAQMASELEHRQQGGTFTMLDAARIPDLPIGPNRPALLAGFGVFALALSIGSALLRESMDGTVKSESQMRETLPDVQLLGTVTRLGTARPRSTSFWFRPWRTN